MDLLNTNVSLDRKYLGDYLQLKRDDGKSFDLIKEAQKSGRSEAHKVWAASRLENLALAIEGFIDHPDIMPSLALYPSAMELAANIRNLASEILKPRYFETDTKTAVFSLKQSLSFFQSRLTTPEAVDIFKTGPKEFIQQIERDMALVPPRTKKM